MDDGFAAVSNSCRITNIFVVSQHLSLIEKIGCSSFLNADLVFYTVNSACKSSGCHLGQDVIAKIGMFA